MSGRALYGRTSPLRGSIIYEPADKLNHNMASLNRVYDKTIRLIHAIDPQRMIFVAPVRAAPEVVGAQTAGAKPELCTGGVAHLSVGP